MSDKGNKVKEGHVPPVNPPADFKYEIFEHFDPPLRRFAKYALIDRVQQLEKTMVNFPRPDCFGDKNLPYTQAMGHCADCRSTWWNLCQQISDKRGKLS